jgi:hypothetical protein
MGARIMLKADLHVVYLGYVSMMITCKMLVYAVILGVKSQLLFTVAVTVACSDDKIGSPHPRPFSLWISESWRD